MTSVTFTSNVELDGVADTVHVLAEVRPYRRGETVLDEAEIVSVTTLEGEEVFGRLDDKTINRLQDEACEEP